MLNQYNKILLKNAKRKCFLLAFYLFLVIALLSDMIHLLLFESIYFLIINRSIIFYNQKYCSCKLFFSIKKLFYTTLSITLVLESITKRSSLLSLTFGSGVTFILPSECFTAKIFISYLCRKLSSINDFPI